jgi:ribosome maturation factor RimP
MDVSWIENVLKDTAYDLYQAYLRNQGSDQVLVVEIEKKGYINLSDCDAVANLLLDVIPDSLDVLLEVSSAGAEREISTLKQFQNALFKTVKITTYDQVLEGTITEVTEEKITLTHQKKVTNIAFIDIQKAQLTIGF